MVNNCEILTYTLLIRIRKEGKCARGNKSSPVMLHYWQSITVYFLYRLVSVALTEDPSLENLLHVYDKYGTYTLSASGCKNVRIIHKFKYSSVWPSIVARSLE